MVVSMTSSAAPKTARQLLAQHGVKAVKHDIKHEGTVISTRYNVEIDGSRTFDLLDHSYLDRGTLRWDYTAWITKNDDGDKWSKWTIHFCPATQFSATFSRDGRSIADALLDTLWGDKRAEVNAHIDELHADGVFIDGWGW